VANDRVYIGSNDGTVHAVDTKSGRRVWLYTTQGPIPSSPIAAGDLVYIGSTDHYVYALSA
jgi:outer membrane protein assembly factor BamB